MKRSIFNKWIIGAACLLLIFAGVCIWFYQQNVEIQKLSAYIREQSEKRMLKWEANKAKPPTTSDKVSTHTHAENTTSTVEKPLTTDAEVPTKPEPKQAQSTAPVQTEAVEVRVSKFGFGPYPELPPDFPWQDLFDPPYYTEDPDHPYKDNPDYELMDRIWVELWKRGERGVVGMGGMESTRLFYPTIRGTIYVRWGPRRKIFGQEYGGRKIRYIDGHPDDIDRLEGVRTESDIPSDLKVLDISEGIDAYEFLKLPR